MKLAHIALLVCFVPMLASDAVGGDLQVVIANFSDYEIQSIYIKADTAEMRSDIQVVPGNRCELTLEDASALREVAIDTGMMHFAFPDMSKMEEYSKLTLELSLDATMRPRLTLDEKSVGGPVDGAHLWADVAGEMRFHIPVDMDEDAVPLSALLDAGTMAAVREMGAWDSPVEEHRLLLPVAFAETTWAALVSMDRASRDAFGDYDADTAQTGAISLRAWREDTPVDGVADALLRMELRPAYLRVTAGEEMEEAKAVNMVTENVGAEEAAALVKAECEGLGDDDSPKAVEAYFVSEATYAEAAAGNAADAPIFRLRVTNAADMTLTYLPKWSVLLED